MPHNEGFVLAAYAVTLAAMAIIIGWVMLDSRARRNELRRLEEAGIRRRSVQPVSAAKPEKSAS